MSLSQTSVMKVYQSVIDDTITSCRDAFLDEGIDEQVLMDLKQLWESKLTSNRAVLIDLPAVDESVAPSTAATTNTPARKGKRQAAGNANNDATQTNGSAENGSVQKDQSYSNGAAQAAPAPVEPPAPAPVPSIPGSGIDPRSIIPIRIALPATEGVENSGRVFSVNVPASAVLNNSLAGILTGPVIQATLGMSPAQASALLQQHITATVQGGTSILMNMNQMDGAASITACDLAANASQLSSTTPTVNSIKCVKQLVVKRTKKCLILQLDGSQNRNNHTDIMSDDDDDDDDEEEEEDVSDDPSDDDDLDDDKDEDDDVDLDAAGEEEQPLNSGDDVSEEDPGELFDTDNVVVCQYDKINRSRNKWKFYLKDGIMNLNGKDYLFQRTTGDAEW